MVRGVAGDDVVVPPTIQALLAARLDQLDAPERGVLERGAVEGRVFHRGAVQALAPDEHAGARRGCTSLVRKELVRPDKAQLPGEDAFRFRHLLIRDAAYDALPKATRAELHERFALWLEEHGADLVELDEILGYHLEQACSVPAGAGHRRSHSGPGREPEAGGVRPTGVLAGRLPGGGRAAGAGARARRGGRDRHRARDRPCQRPPILRSWRGRLCRNRRPRRAFDGRRRPARRAAGAHRAGDDGDVHRAGRRRRPAGGSARGGRADGRGLGRCFRALPRRPGAGDDCSQPGTHGRAILRPTRRRSPTGGEPGSRISSSGRPGHGAGSASSAARRSRGIRWIEEQEAAGVRTALSLRSAHRRSGCRVIWMRRGRSGRESSPSSRSAARWSRSPIIVADRGPGSS